MYDYHNAREITAWEIMVWFFGALEYLLRRDLNLRTLKVEGRLRYRLCCPSSYEYCIPRDSYSAYVKTLITQAVIPK